MSIKVVGVCGSLRKDSATAHAVRLALEGARTAGAEVEFFDLAEHELPFCDGRDAAETYGGDTDELRMMLQEAGGVVIGSPEYHNSMTGALKNALDLCSAEEFEHKMVGVIGVAGGSMGAINTINHLRTVMRGVGAWVVPHQVSISNSGRVFDSAGNILDPLLADRLRKLGTDVTKFSRLIAAGIIEVDETAEV